MLTTAPEKITFTRTQIANRERLKHILHNANHFSNLMLATPHGSNMGGPNQSSIDLPLHMRALSVPHR